MIKTIDNVDNIKRRILSKLFSLISIWSSLENKRARSSSRLRPKNANFNRLYVRTCVYARMYERENLFTGTMKGTCRGGCNRVRRVLTYQDFEAEFRVQLSARMTLNPSRRAAATEEGWSDTVWSEEKRHRNCSYSINKAVVDTIFVRVSAYACTRARWRTYARDTQRRDIGLGTVCV